MFGVKGRKKTLRNGARREGRQADKLRWQEWLRGITTNLNPRAPTSVSHASTSVYPTRMPRTSPSPPVTGSGTSKGVAAIDAARRFWRASSSASSASLALRFMSFMSPSSSSSFSSTSRSCRAGNTRTKTVRPAASLRLAQLQHKRSGGTKVRAAAIPAPRAAVM